MKLQNRNKKIFVISGIEPSKKGAGKFLSYFVEILKIYNDNIELNFIKTPDNYFIRLLRRNRFSVHLKELYYQITRKFISKGEIKDSTIILFHPQSFGLKNSSKLIENNRLTYLYVLDNFFFCKKSYNFLSSINSSCTLCINDVNQSIANKCSIFPNSYNHAEYISFLNTLERNKSKIIFLTQNDNQSRLLKMKFQDNVFIKKIGMFTGEFEVNKDPKKQEKYEFDFLFHNTLSQAKGLKYFVELSQNMPDFKFVIPYDKHKVEQVIGNIENTNIEFHPCSWDTGLLPLILKTKVIIVPSLWSAPIEGSLLKSLYFGNAVALIPQKYSFNEELPLDIYIQLHNDITKSVKNLKTAIDKNISLNENAVKWLNTFIITNIKSLKSFSKDLFC